MKSSCEAVTERIAVGEPLGELADHVAGCAQCQRLADVRTQLVAVHQEVDPGLGFTARMTIGAQQRLAARRRRRIAAGFGATVAAAVVGVVFIMRAPAIDPSAPAVGGGAALQPLAEQPSVPEPDLTEDDALKALVDLADVDRSSRVSARWRDITKPLAPYRRLVKGVKP
ncbi:MAG: hypothetical protein AB7P03_05920 [Kofleriaceae bacterium]